MQCCNFVEMCGAYRNVLSGNYVRTKDLYIFMDGC